MIDTQYPTSKTADIGLLLEGSYPFVSGGVSHWVHQIIENFPQYTFALIFLGGVPEDYKKGLRYTLAKNVVHLEVHYLFEEAKIPPKRALKGNAKAFENIKELHHCLRHDANKADGRLLDLATYLDPEKSVDQQIFLYSKQSWDFITEQYTKYSTEPSFIDYFWTVKNIHKPLWILADIVKNIPDIKLFHSISTGYAGYLGALLHHHFKRPLILTEHGIYTKERRIDLYQSPIVRDEAPANRSITDMGYLRNLWNRYFSTLGRLCYQSSFPIISLFKGAHELQLEGGAQPEKTLVIPNGINLQRFSALRRPLAEKKSLIGLVGRIVPIKDVKGYIRAISILQTKLKNFTAWVVGNENEDPKYAQECHDMIDNLALQECFSFRSHQEMENVYPELRLLVLSSISESMPLVILESFAAGVPVIATDVGACSELIYGFDEEDKALGAAGKIVKIADPLALAEAIYEYMTDDQLWQQAANSAIARAEKYYGQEIMIDKYREIYEQEMP